MVGDSQQTILIVDDDKKLVRSLQILCEIHGYDVHSAVDGEKALKAIAKHAPDVILLDIAMPKMNGLAFLKEIAGADGKPKYPVVVLTARPHLGEFFSDVDVDAFLEKPFDSQELLDEIARALARRRESSFSASRSWAVTTEPPRGRRVLLADDERAVRLRIEKALHDEGYEVEALVDGTDVVERAVIWKPSILLMRHILSGMNGDCIATLLSEIPHAKKIPVILYADTVVPEIGLRLKAKCPGVAYVGSVEPGRLLQSVKHVLEA